MLFAYYVYDNILAYDERLHSTKLIKHKQKIVVKTLFIKYKHLDISLKQ